MGCMECPYRTKKKVRGIIKPSTICIVGESPGKEELIRGEPFVGPSGQLLMKSLREFLGLEREDVAIINALECELDQDYKRPYVKLRNILLLCRDKFLKKISIIKPDLIIALGDIAVKQVLGKNVNISSVRGKLIDHPELKCRVFSTYHPSAILRRGGESENNPFWITFRSDLLFLKKFLSGENPKPILYSEFNGDTSFFSRKKYLAIDCEWDKEGNLLIFSMSNGEETMYVLPEKINDFLRDRLEKLLSKKVILLANRPVDERKLKEYGINLNSSPYRIDIFNMAKLINENFEISLEKISEIYGSRRNIKEMTKGRKKQPWELEKDALITYNCQDSYVTASVFEPLYKKLKEDEKLFRYWKNFILPVEEMLASICSQGFKIDREKLVQNKAFVSQKFHELHIELINELPESIIEKHKEKGLKLTRLEILRDFLFLDKKGLKLTPIEFTPTNLPSVSESVLVHYAEHPWINKYLTWAKINKLINTFFNGLERNIHPDGKIYPSIVLWGTKSGRTACFNPNIQQVPRQMPYVEYYKSLFEAPKGWLMGTRDLSQSEIRVIGWLAGEKRILEALKSGIDIHTLTASLVLGKKVEEVTKDDRQIAKSINFGLIYGQSAPSFKEYVYENYGLTISLEEAENFRNRFFETYPSLIAFHNYCQMIVEKNKYIRSPLGRIRRLPEIDSSDYAEKNKAIRKAINFPVQSFSSDLTLIGMYLFWNEIKDKRTVRLLWMIHDSIFFIAREDVFDKYMELLKECMEKRAPEYIKEKFNVKIGYPVESDGKFGKSWAELKDYEG